MKKQLLILLVIVSLIVACHSVSAQGVGIGTTTPHPSAALQVNSTSKGLLIPSMTIAQRLAIANPAEGLLVHESTNNRIFVYRNGSWQFLIDNTYWAQSSTRNWVYTGTDSVGIGTAAPGERLDVNGTARIRNNLTVNGDVNADNAVSADLLLSRGNLVAAGNGTISGDLSTNSSVIVNNSSGILQLRAGGENKGYFQISGDNVRLGTNAGNSAGSVIIRMNGAERMRVNPNGMVDMTGNIRKAATGTAGMLPVAYGMVSREGNIVSGTGNFTITHIADGEYDITLNAAVTDPVTLLTPVYEFYTQGGSNFISGSAIMYTRRMSSTVIRVFALGNSFGDLFRWDNRFSFVIYGDAAD